MPDMLMHYKLQRRYEGPARVERSHEITIMICICVVSDKVPQ